MAAGNFSGFGPGMGSEDRGGAGAGPGRGMGFMMPSNSVPLLMQHQGSAGNDFPLKSASETVLFFYYFCVFVLV